MSNTTTFTTNSGTGGTGGTGITLVGAGGRGGVGSVNGRALTIDNATTTSVYVGGSLSNRLAKDHSTICSKDYRRFKDKLTQILKKPV